jgi:hypothetical protein
VKEVCVRSAIGFVLLSVVGVTVAGVGVGCQGKHPAEPAARGDVPPRPWEPPLRQRDPIKPMPEPEYGGDVPPPPFYDAPLVGQRTPEEKAFLEAYEAIGRPRMMVLVSGGAAAGRRDDLAVDEIDYESMQNILTDWFAADGRVDLLSPAENQRLSDARAGAPQATRADAGRGADVVVRVRAQQTRQTRQEAAVRLVGEAVNADDGRSIGRAVVDIPPPLDKPQLNKYTRWLGRRLMDQMAATWRAMGPARGADREPGVEPMQRVPGAAPDDIRRPDSRRDGPAPTTRPSEPAPGENR